MVLNLELAQRAGVVRGLALSRMLESAPDVPPSTLREFDDQARRTLTGLEGWLEVRSADRLLIDTRQPAGQLPSLRSSTPGTLLAAPQTLPLQHNEELGIYHASLVQPVMRDGEPVLNLTLTVLPNEFQRIIDQQKINPQWVAAIIDSEGRVVARHPGGAAHTGRLATEDLRQRLSTSREGLMHSHSLDGIATTLYFRTTAQGWTYLTGMPRSQFEGVVPADARNLALGTLLLSTLAVLAALGVSRSIVRPIHIMKQLALDMKGGQRVLPKETGITECNEVAQVMASASQAIQNAQSEMEQKVEQAIAMTRHAEQRMSHSHRLEALGRLTGGVAHDFNNLLGVISNSGHLMLRKTDNPELTAALEATLRAVDSGSRLTQHLLRFAGRQSVRPSVIPLRAFMTDTAELIRAVMGHRIELTVQVDPLAPALFADPNELELALINLALNARDAISEHGRVELRAGPAEPEDVVGLPHEAYVVIAVTDDGCGISESIVKRVFEPFFSTKDAQQASGLGLSQVYGFCQQSGGTVRLDSTQGLGTTVSMVLPSLKAAASGIADAVAVDAPEIQGMRVLLVEDNKELRGVTTALLESLGCVVVCAASAADALRILQPPRNIDAMISDVLMPGSMNGVMLAQRVRQMLPGLPIVLISGHRGEVDDIADFPFVHKPYTPEALVAALQEALGSHPQQQAHPA
ncbi:signal transduction histidine kinase/CheY-like chemotaxis protein [Hydrogenophaga palleronii]|uniref:histidine kinase n=1 Tax=Hydrogenophaga palleronii TaxID=65655 RepID=A0ABU1WN02_9BURK|nr:ATP-binding protein [Hydrogenophaga palleronii]MDR7150658.1 signal transduction histidine kinase/CheY-like chemotaxis protein [Hydrogenophaga palleronii]